MAITSNATRLYVYVARAYGSPPDFASWKNLWDALPERIDITMGDTPSTATIWFPRLRWQESRDVRWGDRIRIQTKAGHVAFSGFVVSYISDFAGGTDNTQGHERNAIVCRDHRWLLARMSPVYGQMARGPDDYTDYGTADEAAIAASCFFADGRRTVFNADGLPDKDPVLYEIQADETPVGETPIFADRRIAEYWTAGDMIRYLLCPSRNGAYPYLDIADASDCQGLDHADWGTVVHDICVDGLNTLAAIAHVARSIGWSFREDWDSAGDASLVFFRTGAASAYSRSESDPIILHQLHAPAAGEELSASDAASKLVWQGRMAEDMEAVVNSPVALGGVHKFELTAELVPAWDDDDLTVDEANVFFSEADLREEQTPDDYDYYKYHHARGSLFRRDAGRRWSLNETGRYSDTTTYDRGAPFDFAAHVAASYIKDGDQRLYGPFARQLLPCLTALKDSFNSVGIVVEFSFDGGSAWQTIPGCQIRSLTDEAGLYIAEPNLAELVDKAEGDISSPGNATDGLQLNYFTSLADDKLAARAWKSGQWKTRVRVTACVQLDKRLLKTAEPSGATGSPFELTSVYDFSQRYRLEQQTDGSEFYGGSLPVRDYDDSTLCETHLGKICDACKDLSVSAVFTLYKLFLADAAGEPVFCVGDCVEKITGREYSLAADMGGRAVFPEILKITHDAANQKTTLILRDLRFAAVNLV